MHRSFVYVVGSLREYMRHGSGPIFQELSQILSQSIQTQQKVLYVCFRVFLGACGRVCVIISACASKG